MAVVNRRIEEKIERRKMAKKAEIIKAETIIIEPAQIQDMIHVIRGQRVILDSDLARLYGVETKQLKRQVRRNITRFPSDFMFELTREEYNLLRCQNGTIENGRGEYSKYLPFAFTENGVAMLSSVLTSELAVQTNIQIMRAFVFLKNSLAAIDKTTLQQEKLELEIEKLRLYVEEILKDQNDTNEELHQQIENLQLSLTELGAQVEGYWDIKPTISKLVFPARGKFQVVLKDGRQITMPISAFPSIKKVPVRRRKNWYLMGGGFTWDECPEVIHVEQILGNYAKYNHDA